MSANTRFAVALHALAALAWLGQCRTSEQLAAGTVNTNPVVLRRILARLVRAGILEGHAGRAGGFRLARPPEEIDLAEVYRAVEDEGLFGIHANPALAGCPVSSAIKPVLGEIFREAEAAATGALAGRRLSDLLARLG